MLFGSETDLITSFLLSCHLKSTPSYHNTFDLHRFTEKKFKVIRIIFEFRKIGIEIARPLPAVGTDPKEVYPIFLKANPSFGYFQILLQ